MASGTSSAGVAIASVATILIAGGVAYYLYTKSKSTTTTSTTTPQITVSTTTFSYVS